MVFIRVIRFLAWASSPKFPFRLFFDFRFGVNASHFFNFPHPIQTLRNPRYPSPDVVGLFSNNVVSFSSNVVLRDHLFSLNVVSK